ncbi:MAG TPA: hypothetical protein VN436_15180 [Holophaga sp.]|nr:hypothetical protein [Holophaga sp.]
MLFRPKHGLSLLQGKLVVEAGRGRSRIVALDGSVFRTGDVDFVVPDDEAQGIDIREAGFQTHTPISMVVGLGSTGL